MADCVVGMIIVGFHPPSDWPSLGEEVTFHALPSDAGQSVIWGGDLGDDPEITPYFLGDTSIRIGDILTTHYSEPGTHTITAQCESLGPIKTLDFYVLHPPGPDPEPGQSIENVELKSLTFTSDHAVLLNEEWEWSDGAERYPKPEWEAVQQDIIPITQTRNTHVRIILELLTTPPSASPIPGRITGVCLGYPGGILDFKSDLILRGGTVTVDLTADGPLPDWVATIGGVLIEWNVSVGEKTLELGRSGPHKIYVTYDKPSGTSVTATRIRYVVEEINYQFDQNDVTEFPEIIQGEKQAAAGEFTEADYVNAVWIDMRRRGFAYALKAPKPLTPWLIMGGQKAECGPLADLFMEACLMIGLPSEKFEKGYVYPLAQKSGAKFDPSESAMVQRPPDSQRHRDQGHFLDVEFETLIWMDGKTMWNRYQGCIRYDNRYYAGGAGGTAVFETPVAVIERLGLVTGWQFYLASEDDHGFCFDPGPFPEAYW